MNVHFKSSVEHQKNRRWIQFIQNIIWTYLPNFVLFITALKGTFKHKIMFFGLPLLTSMIILFFALEYASRKTKYINATLRQEHFFWDNAIFGVMLFLVLMLIVWLS